MSCPAAPISAYLLREFHVSLVTRHSRGGGGGLGGGGDRYQDPWRRGLGSKNRKMTPTTTSTTPGAPIAGLRERGNDNTRDTGRSALQNTVT